MIRGKRLFFSLALAVAVPAVAVPAVAAAQLCSKDPSALLGQVIHNTKVQKTTLSSVTSTVTFQSNIGNSNSTAQYLRKINANGQINYNQIYAEGSKVSFQAIHQAVQRDIALSQFDRDRNLFTDENYKFEFISESQDIYRFKITAAEDREGLLSQGEYWIDRLSCAPVRVQGSPVHHNVLVRQLDMAEDLQLVKGVVLPKRLLVSFKVFALFGMLSGSLDSQSQIRPEDVILKTNSDLSSLR